MPITLTSQAHLAAIGPDLVVLDIAQNAYYCLPGAAQAAVPGQGGEIVFADEDLARQFAAAGFLAGPENRTRPRCALPATPFRDLRDEGGGPLPRGARRDMARAFAGMVGGYYGRPLKALVRAAARGRQHPGPGDAAACALRAKAFNRLLPWVPFQGECLFRSFMLLRFLRLKGHDATWVFGVRTWPFQAHCWLQSGETVLDDLVDRVQPFTPIFAV